jgi:hypothetical protein
VCSELMDKLQFNMKNNREISIVKQYVKCLSTTRWPLTQDRCIG